MKDIISFAEFIAKYPNLLLILIIPIMVIVSIFLIKQTNNLRKFIKESINEELSGIKKDIEEIKEAYQKADSRHYIYEALYNNLSTIEYFFKKVNEKNDIIFRRIKEQLIRMNEDFQSNYLNGSHKERAKEILGKAEEVILEELDGLVTDSKQKFSKVVLVYIKLLNVVVERLIEKLCKIESKQTKNLLIKAEFDAINRVVMYLKIKYPQYMDMKQEQIEQEMFNYYNSFKPKDECYNENAILAGLI